MKLYFIRHGKAGYNAPNDETRPLSEEGIQQAKNNGRLLNYIGVTPTIIYSSPRRRAQETAQLIADILDTGIEINDACNFDFTADKARQLVATCHDDGEILFVGHNPSMSEVVTNLTGAYVDLSTCAIACVSRFNPNQSQSAILKWLITPKLVSAMLKSEGF